MRRSYTAEHASSLFVLDTTDRANAILSSRTFDSPPGGNSTFFPANEEDGGRFEMEEPVLLPLVFSVDVRLPEIMA